MIQDVGTNGLINRDSQGTALQGGNGIVEIAGIKIYKSMNIPFLGRYGTKYGGTTGQTDPGNTGDFVNPALEDASTAQTGINNDYGTGAEFGLSPVASSSNVKLLVLLKQSDLKFK